MAYAYFYVYPLKLSLMMFMDCMDEFGLIKVVVGLGYVLGVCKLELIVVFLPGS